MKSVRLKRVEAEIFHHVAPLYGTEKGRVSYDTQDGEWVCIKGLSIPPALTQNGDGLVDILLVVPKVYPQIPPDGFYCDQALRIFGHYFQANSAVTPHRGGLGAELQAKGWNWYCAHAGQRGRMQNQWRPSNNVEKGDNLMRYLHLCLSILGTEARKRDPNKNRFL